MRLSLLTFGSLQIALDDAPLTGFVSDKARAMLVYLALETAYPHRRETLAGLFWPESSERHARHTLSQTLSNIRELIGDKTARNDLPFLEVNRQVLQVNTESDLWVDAAQFDAVLNVANTPALADLKAAVSLYRGHFMEGFSLRGCADFDEWVLMQRERLQRQMMDILGEIVSGYRVRGEYERALPYVWRQLDLDSWREDVHRQAMWLLAMTGQRNTALEQFEVCRYTLAENLDVGPEAETLALYQAIKANEIGPHNKIEMPQGRDPRTAFVSNAHNLPASLNALIGRDHELQDAQERLNNSDCRLLSVVGPGGIGKTHFAIVLAQSLLERYADGVFFISLGTLQDTRVVTVRLAQVLGFTYDEKAGAQLAQLAGYLRTKRMLLVLDNVEQLLDKNDAYSLPAMISQILQTAPDVCFVVTSRHRLNMLGETVFPITELTYPDEQTHKSLEDFDAIQLFVRSARQVRPDFMISDHNAVHIQAICRYCGGLPLALLLAASWTSAASLQVIADELAEDSLEMLESDWLNVDQRHRSIRAVFDQSWQSLSPHGQSVFKRLSVFSDGFTLTAAREIIGVNPKDLRNLIEASLLRREASGRYTFHPLVQEFASEKLARDSDAFVDMHSRHCAWYCSWAASLYDDLRNENELVTLERLDAERSNLLAAWDWVIDQKLVPQLRETLEVLTLYLIRRGLGTLIPKQLRRAIDRFGAFDILDAVPSAYPRERYLLMVDLLAHHYGWAEDTQQAAQHLDGLLANLMGMPGETRYERARVSLVRSQICGVGTHEAREYAHQSLDLFEQLEMDWHVIQVLAWLRECYWQAGEYEQAKLLGMRQLALSRKIGGPWLISTALTGLSGVAMYYGDVEEGLRLSQESLEIAKQFGNRYFLANGLYSLGNKYVMLGRYDDAHRFMQQSADMYADLVVSFAMVFPVLGFVKCQLGRYSEAIAWINAHLEVIPAGEGMLCKGFGLSARGWAEIGLGAFDAALLSLQECQAAYTAINIVGEMGQTHAMMAIAHVLNGDTVVSRIALSKALNLAVNHKNRVAIMMTLTAYALLLIHDGRAMDAVATQAVIMQAPTACNSTWFADVLGKRMDAVVASLDVGDVEAARAAGLANGFGHLLAEIGAYL